MQLSRYVQKVAACATITTTITTTNCYCHWYCICCSHRFNYKYLNSKQNTDIAFKRDQTVLLPSTFSLVAFLVSIFFFFLSSSFSFYSFVGIFSALYLVIQVKLNSNISFIVFLFCVMRSQRMRGKKQR